MIGGEGSCKQKWGNRYGKAGRFQNGQNEGKKGDAGEIANESKREGLSSLT
jgi:hypothetical protein